MSTRSAFCIGLSALCLIFVYRFSCDNNYPIVIDVQPDLECEPRGSDASCTHAVVRCSDLTEATLAGASISLVAAATIVFLLLAVSGCQLPAMEQMGGK